MRYLLMVVVLASSYFVEWIPNNATVEEPATASSSPGEFPWQLSGG
ncbi:MAG TPA: hypothetical protein VF432_02905 [Thermoanaerobaculia bacterium]